MTLELILNTGAYHIFHMVIWTDPYQPWPWYHTIVIKSVLKKWLILEILSEKIHLQYLQGDVTLWEILVYKDPMIWFDPYGTGKTKNKWGRNN